jgi:hypothetical protein
MTRPSRAGLPRRSFLRTTAGAAVAGSLLVSGSTPAAADEDEPAGYLVITYDDGPIEDYELTFQVHQEYGVPGCVAACPGLMDSDDSDDWLHPDQLREMYDAGWEVMSHTVDHRAVGEIPITENVTEGDVEIPVASNLHGRIEGDPIVLFDDDGNRTEATVAGRGGSGDGQYIELQEPIDVSLSPENDARERYTDEFTERILADSQARLEEIVGDGQVTGFIYPYERHDGLAEELVPEYYETTPRAHQGNGLNPTYAGVDPFTISREYYEEDRMTEEEIAEFLDQVANEPDFGILGAHSHYDTVTEERIATTIEMALERDIEIVTLQEALDTFGVVEAPERTERDADETSGTDDDEDDEDADTDPDADEDEDEEESEGLFDRILSLFRSLFD